MHQVMTNDEGRRGLAVFVTLKPQHVADEVDIALSTMIMDCICVWYKSSQLYKQARAHDVYQSSLVVEKAARSHADRFWHRAPDA